MGKTHGVNKAKNPIPNENKINGIKPLSVSAFNSLEESVIEKEVQKLEGQDSDESKVELSIAKSKIEALNSTYYEKIQ